MRINKYLAMCGLASRRKCENFIKNGDISVNGHVLDGFSYDVGANDNVFYKGALLTPVNNFVYYKMNKPKGCLCTVSDDKGRKTIYDYLDNKSLKLFSVGRLDYNTEGLIIITNDGDFANRVCHPSNEIEKEYIVKIKGQIKESELAVLRAGVVENGVKMPKAKVVLKGFEENLSRISVIIKEGQNHQVRRMFAAIGKDIKLLKRVAVGEVKLGGMKRGEYKELTSKELFLLTNSKWDR